MNIGKLLFTLGIALIVFGIISGFQFYYSSTEGNSKFSYSLNAGKIIFGAILVYFGNRLKIRE